MFEYQLKPSLFLLRFNLGIYCLSFLVILFYNSASYIPLLLVFLLILLIFQEWSSYRQANSCAMESLSINTLTGTIEWQKNGNNRQFTDYSVYTCRWGMILVLKQSRFRNSLILLADRFNNQTQYLDLRFHLIRLNQAIHAS